MPTTNFWIVSGTLFVTFRIRKKLFRGVLTTKALVWIFNTRETIFINGTKLFTIFNGDIIILLFDKTIENTKWIIPKALSVDKGTIDFCFSWIIDISLSYRWSIQSYKIIYCKLYRSKLLVNNISKLPLYFIWRSAIWACFSSRK